MKNLIKLPVFLYLGENGKKQMPSVNMDAAFQAALPKLIPRLHFLGKQLVETVFRPQKVSFFLQHFIIIQQAPERLVLFPGIIKCQQDSHRYGT